MGATAELDGDATEQIVALEQDLRVWLVAYTAGDAARPSPRYTLRVRPVPLDEHALQRIRELERRLGFWLVAYDASVQE